MTDAELTAAVPYLVEGTVLERVSMDIREDPFLPPGWESDPAKAAFLSAGLQEIKWRVDVTLWLKGTGPQEIWVRRVADDSSVQAAQPPGSVGDDPQAGNIARFWLQADEWFQQNQFILEQARILE